MAGRQTRAQLEAENMRLRSENDILRSSKIFDNILIIIRDLIRWGGIGFICYCVVQSIEALSGKSTYADIGLNLSSNQNILSFFATLLGIFGVGYGMQQNRLRKDVIERIEKKNAALERHIDPARSSSMLTSRGDTRVEDEI
jgi:hypothetical protein